MVDMFRCIPVDRLRAFVEKYIREHYELDEFDTGKTQFSFDSGVPERRVYSILTEEQANFSFDFVDRMLTRLDCVHVWHLPREMGGFKDYFEPDIPPAPAVPTDRQRLVLSSNRHRIAARKLRETA